jgi:hypothetical protein
VEDARRIAVAGYRQVLEDGKDVCNSESDAEYSDHGEQWTDADIDTAGASLASVRLTSEQANAIRANTRQGRAGGLATDRAPG